MTLVVILGSTAVGAAQAMSDLLSPAAGKRWQDLGDGETEPGRGGSAAWPLGLFALLGNFLSIKETTQFPFPVPRVEYQSEGSLLCGWGSAECSL